MNKVQGGKYHEEPAISRKERKNELARMPAGTSSIPIQSMPFWETAKEIELPVIIQFSKWCSLCR
jgi:hypothetical protein